MEQTSIINETTTVDTITTITPITTTVTTDGNHNLSSIIENMLLGNKPNITFQDFIELVNFESEYSVCWKPINVGEKVIFMFSTEWHITNELPKQNEKQNYITKYFNSLIFDAEFNVLMYAGPKVYDSNRDNINIQKVKEFIGDKPVNIYEAYEGTTINVYHYDGEWRFSTKRMFNMNDSQFGSQKTHGSMFNEAVNIDELKAHMKPEYSYHFTLTHPDNSHLLKIEKPALYLIAVREKGTDKIVDKSKYEDLLTLNGIMLPIQSSYETLDTDQNNKQGIIVNYDDFIFRIYNQNYGKNLALNPFFNSKQEEYFYKYQKDGFVDVENLAEKSKTIASFNFVAIMLQRTLLHFTKFAKFFNQQEKEKYPTYKFIKINETDFEKLSGHNAIIRNMYKLQHLPFKVKTITEISYDQVKHHLKYHCSPQDLYSMFKSFNTDATICLMIGYRSVGGQTATNISDFSKL